MILVIFIDFSGSLSGVQDILGGTLTPGVSSYFEQSASQEEFYFPSKIISELKIPHDQLKSKCTKFTLASSLRMREKGDVYLK